MSLYNKEGFIRKDLPQRISNLDGLLMALKDFSDNMTGPPVKSPCLLTGAPVEVLAS